MYAYIQILRRAHVTIFAAAKHEVINIVSVSAALVMQHVKRMRRIVFSSVACLDLPYFQHYLKQHHFRRHNYCT